MDLPPPPGQDMDVTSSLARRLRMLEEAHANTRKKLELTESNMLSDQKRSKAIIGDLNHEIDDLKKTVRTLKEDLAKIIIELQGTAKAEQVAMLAKYVELWQPVQFVTAKQVRNIVIDELDARRIQEKPNTQLEPPRKEKPAKIQREPPAIIEQPSEPVEEVPPSEEQEEPVSSSPMPDPSLKKKKGLDELF